MKALRSKQLLFAVVLGVALPQVAMANPFAGEDFDTGGLDAVTAVYNPDNNANGGAYSSAFDRFGITGRTQGPAFPPAPPFDAVDDSAGSFAPDRLGVIPTGKMDNFFLIGDTVNGDTQNGSGGQESATWTFDISGRSNIQLSIDMGMVGSFDNDDLFNFSYQIDAQPVQNAFLVQRDTVNDVPYTVTMESGDEYDRYDIPGAFFDELNWLVLTDPLGGPTASFFYHPDDADQDGFVDLTGSIDGTVATRAYGETNEFGTFDTTEQELFENPLQVTSPSGVTVLTNDLQTISTPIVGTGTTLTLTLDAFANGSLEYFVFDDIELEEVVPTTLVGDFNEDGMVDDADYAFLRNGLGVDAEPLGTGDGSGTLDAGDLPFWINNFGASSPAAVAGVPEPATGVLAFAMIAGLAVRRRS